MVLIYTHKITNRVRYIFRLLFVDVLASDVKFTDDVQQFLQYRGPKLSYTNQPLGDELFFLAKPLLFESGIKEQNINVFEWQNSKVFFATSKTSSFPFDPFACSFYLVSRYEEYLPTIRDDHNRFEAHESLAWQNGFLGKPVVNEWALRIKNLILQRFPAMLFPERKYEYISTIDIDNAYAYKQKGFMRTAGAYLRSFLYLDIKEVLERTNVLLGIEKDIYDTYDFQLEIQKKYNLKTIYFFLFAEYGLNDKNLPVQNKKFKALIKSIADTADVGIHPSYGSNKDTEKLATEIKRLSKVLNREVTKSRQHFLKLTFPDTYRNLLELGITDDYSMGFASEIGFRASICNSFYFYDLDLEIETKLRVHPFMVMDASLKYYMKVEPKEAMHRIKPLIDEVRAVNGTFMSLWHNESMSDAKQWAGWKQVYADTVRLAVTD
jgi:hypothetical protein